MDVSVITLDFPLLGQGVMDVSVITLDFPLLGQGDRV